MPKTRPKLVLIDAHALIHRAFHAIPFLSKKDGELTNAVYGFTSTVLSVMKELKPEYIAVSFDLPEPTFRHKMYQEYKATRQKAPDELRSQFGRVREVVDALGIPVFEVPGFEADDVLGSLAKQSTAKNDLDAYIVTGDKDMLQLLDDHVKVFTLRKGINDTVIYDPKMLMEQVGLTPDEFIEYKALKGDASDNIPGVPGIGDKTATTLIQKYKDLESVYKALDEDPAKHPDFKPKVRSNLEEFKDQAYLSRDLSRIVTDMKLKFDLKACQIHDFKMDTALKLFKDLEFPSLVPRLQEAMAADASETVVVEETKERDWKGKKYQLVETGTFDDFLKKLKKEKVVAFDTETNSLDTVAPDLVGMSFSWKADTGFYLPVGHEDGPNLDKKKTLAALKPILEDPKVGIVGHHLKYDYEVMRGNGIEMQGLAFDTMLGSYLLNPGARTLKLDRLAYQELGYEMQPITELIGDGKDQLPFGTVPPNDAVNYAAEDADITWQLYEKMSAEVAKADVASVLKDIELPLVPVLAHMEQRGVKIDSAFLKKMGMNLGKRMTTIEKKVHKMAGHDFNLKSPAQLSKVLFDELKVSGAQARPGTQKSTAADKLEALKGKHPIIDEILTYREIAKLKNTYTDVLPKLVRKDTGRLHTSYSQTIAATGRLSSSDPNLQNIPIRTELGREIRKAFVTEKGYTLVSADYSQFELRIAAHISGDERLSESFRQGKDIHALTAAEVAGVPIEKVTPEQRYAAKAVNFSILYGATPHGVARSTGMSISDAQEYIDKYFRTYPKLREYMDSMILKVEKDGYVETLFGRRRYLPEINSSTYPVRESAKRMAVNMPVQGTQADILKIAMIRIDDGLQKVSKDAHLLLTVHDELVVEAPTKDAGKVAKFVEDTMENAYQLDVPIVAEAKIGDNWGEMKEVPS
ncbi:DNA polymerase I [Patescibacteria group bacterium]|nr:DNA polymerase I [Patescibacteria group bacterium]